MLDLLVLLFSILSTTTAGSTLGAPGSGDWTASGHLAFGDWTVSKLPAVGEQWEPAPVDAATHRKVLPKAARRALAAGRSELWAEGTRLVVRPTDAWLSEGEERVGRLFVSEDKGHTWKTQKLPACGNAGCALRLERGGALQMMTGFEASCGGGYQTRALGHVDGRDWQEGPWPWDSPLSFTLPADGWAAGYCRPGWNPDAQWKGPATVPCVVNATGREVYLPVEWDWEAEKALQMDPQGRYVEYKGRRFAM